MGESQIANALNSIVADPHTKKKTTAASSGKRKAGRLMVVWGKKERERARLFFCGNVGGKVFVERYASGFGFASLHDDDDAASVSFFKRGSVCIAAAYGAAFSCCASSCPAAG
jgi:hypothetical protein